MDGYAYLVIRIPAKGHQLKRVEDDLVTIGNMLLGMYGGAWSIPFGECDDIPLVKVIDEEFQSEE